MMNKLFKKAVFALLACGLVSTASYAADMTPSITGMVSAYVVSEPATAPATGSVVNMKAEGDLTIAVSTTSGAWTFTAAQRIDLDTDDGTASPTNTDQYITMEDASMAITAGRFDPCEITLGGTYNTGSITGMSYIGDTGIAPSDSVTVALKDLGLTALLSMDADVTSIGAIYSGAFSGVDVAAEFLSKSPKTGTASSVVALAGKYGISDTMSIAANIDNTNNAGTTTSTTLIYFDMGLGADSGINVGIESQTTGSTSTSKTALTYSKAFDAAAVYASYFANGTSTSIGGGITMSF